MIEAPKKHSALQRYAALTVFVLVAVVLSGAFGFFTAPGEWYASLDKPPFNPPNWVFAPVWFVLYALIAVAGWLVWLKAPRSTALGVWAVQMAVNWIWSPVFFRLQSPWGAAIIIIALFALVAIFIRLAAPIDRRAAWLFVPYALWVGFASLLNVSVAFLN